MSPWQSLLLSSLGAAFVLIAWRHLCGIHALRQVPIAEPLPPRHWERDDYWPMVSVVVDAGALAGRVEACIESLRSQDYPRYEILLAVPQGDIASWTWLERPEAENGRLRLIPVTTGRDPQQPEVPLSRTAVDHARGSWLLFARGNETFHPAGLTSLLREALHHRTDLVKAVPSLSVRPARGTGFLTVVGAVLSPSGLPFPIAPSRGEDRMDAAVAGDTLLLVRRMSYDEVGGFGPHPSLAVRTLQFVRGFRKAGLRVRVVRAAELVDISVDAHSNSVSARAADSCGALVAGSRLRWLALSARLLATTLFPFVALGIVLGLAAASPAAAPRILVATAGLVALTLQAAREFLIARSLHLPWIWLLSRATTVPTAAVIVGRIFPRPGRTRTALESPTAAPPVERAASTH